MKSVRTATVAIVLAMLVAPVRGQWFDYPTPGIPRDADGRPFLTGPGPRTADGRPDLSGIWNPEGTRYLRNLAVDLGSAGVPFQPWAKALYEERLSGAHARDEPDANCLPHGVPKINAASAPFKIIQTSGVVVILYEAFTLWRQIFTDGRPLPTDPNPTWLGYSVGRWEGDTLVVETIGFNGRTWLDTDGHPTTDALRVIERFSRPSFGRLQIEITIDDPKAYTRPWTVTQRPRLLPDTELLEFICLENEQFTRRGLSPGR